MAKKGNSIPVGLTGKKSKVVRYNKWGYFFLIPFVVVFIAFTLIPLVNTIYNSFFENYRNSRLEQIGPNFVGFDNYKEIFKRPSFFGVKGDIVILRDAANTAIMWIMGFIPQILVSLLLAQWFSDTRLKLKGSAFFKTVIYMPNLIMASAFSMLFYVLFSETGPINDLIVKCGGSKFNFFSNVWATRTLIATLNFLMWFGNTTILLMAGILGIDVSLYEAAEVDGANSWQRFTKITLPLLRPILIYVVITSLIGGIQMYDIPKILNAGGPKNSTETLIMYLQTNLYSKNYGIGGAISVVLFIITAILSLSVYMFMYRKKGKEA